MAATPEAKVKKAVTDLLDKYGAYWFKPVMNGMGRSGVPDIIVCYRGRFIGVECKAGKGKPTALQTLELEKINKANGVGIVIREDTLDLLEQVLKEII